MGGRKDNYTKETLVIAEEWEDQQLNWYFAITSLKEWQLGSVKHVVLIYID